MSCLTSTKKKYKNFLKKKLKNYLDSTSSVTPSVISPQPIKRQCFSILRLKAIFSPIYVREKKRKG